MCLSSGREVREPSHGIAPGPRLARGTFDACPIPTLAVAARSSRLRAADPWSRPRTRTDDAAAYHARTRLPQLPALLRGAERLARRHVDHAHRHELARLPPHGIGPPARRRRILRSDPHAGARALRRRAGRSMGSTSDLRRHPGALAAAVRCARRTHPRGPDHRDGHPRAAGGAGDHQCVRHAGAPVVRRRDGGGPRRSTQRDRPQLVDGEREPHSFAT